jgi:hypothetical protein
MIRWQPIACSQCPSHQALKPPGMSSLKWFFEVMLELEWQTFQKEAGPSHIFPQPFALIKLRQSIFAER